MSKEKSVLSYYYRIMHATMKIATIAVACTLYTQHSLAIEPAALPEFNQKFYQPADSERIRSLKKHQHNAYQQRAGSLKTKVSASSTVISRFTSGTGFFIDYHHIITNEHVVQSCKHIRIRGAVQPSYAQLVSIDKDSDLALLRTSRSPIRPAALRGSKQIGIGDSVSVMGYPLEHGVTGSYILKNARITDVSSDSTSSNRIQFTDSVEKGNSGGPLLDASGTVIGVIVGKMNFYLANGSTINKSKPIKTSSVAINLTTLKRFLDKFHVLYYTDDVNTPFTTQYMEQKAQQYIVNIHCVKTPSEEAGADPRFPYHQVAFSNTQ